MEDQSMKFFIELSLTLSNFNCYFLVLTNAVSFSTVDLILYYQFQEVYLIQIISKVFSYD